MDNSEKFRTAIETLKSGTVYVVHGEITSETQFNDNVKWVTGEENNTAITVDNCPHSEITWTKVKAEMDKL